MCSSQREAEPSSEPRGSPSSVSICGETKILSALTSQSKTRSPEPDERQCPPLGVGDQPLRQRAAGEGVLDHGEADQQHDQHEPAEQRRRHEIALELPGHREAGRRHPDRQQEPGRDQHHGALIAMRRQMQDQHEADGGDGRDRDARDARRHRRVEDGKPDQPDEPEHPDRSVTWL